PGAEPAHPAHPPGPARVGLSRRARTPPGRNLPRLCAATRPAPAAGTGTRGQDWKRFHSLSSAQTVVLSGGILEPVPRRPACVPHHQRRKHMRRIRAVVAMAAVALAGSVAAGVAALPAHADTQI